MTLEMYVLDRDMDRRVATLLQLMESQSSPFDKWIFNGSTYINKDKKNLHRFASIQKDYTLFYSYHKNEWQQKHGQYNGRVNECS